MQGNTIHGKEQVEEITRVWANLTKEINNSVNVLEKYQKTTSKLPSDYLNSLNKIKETQTTLNNETSKTIEVQKRETAAKREAARINNAIIQGNAKLTAASSKQAQELARIRFETAETNKRTKEAAVLSSKLATEYQKLVIKMNQAATTVQNLTAKKLQGITLSKKEQDQLRKSQAEFTRYNKAVLGADASVKRFQRNVGNYPKGLNAAAGAVRSLAGAMGLLGGAFLAVRVFTDAFRRIREFDKEMQNMSGILRTTRPELKEIENRIIKVASVSIKTSNEVAQLATSLFVLGKSKQDVLNLLKPTNDLSIALGATSEETGEFLVQTLNAFGKGSESATEFADTIAAIRTSTSLDFQKMRDSFQYITPISNILGRDLAYTGAVVGVLADNGLKAESAGRLLATAQIKLATAGKTLQEGLDEINDAYKEGKSGIDLLKIANESFGKQAAKIGVILATQQDRLEQYDKKIRQAAGSLDDLVNEQLKSVDAQLKITTSTWEEFVLSIENGEGTFSRTLGTLLGYINDLLKGLTLMNKTQKEYNDYLREDTAAEYYDKVTKALKEAGKFGEKIAIQDADRARDRIEQIQSEIKAIEDLAKKRKSSTNPNGINTQKEREQLAELSAQLGQYQGILKASEDFITQNTDAINDNTDATGENTDEGIRNIKFLREQIKLERERLEELNLNDEAQRALIPSIQARIDAYQKEIDALIGSGKARKSVLEAVKGSIAYYEQIISKLEEQQKKLSRNGREWKIYQNAIDSAKKSLQDLIIEIKGFNTLKSFGDFESSWERVKDILTKPLIIEGIDYDKALEGVEEWSKKYADQQKKIAEIHKYYADYRESVEKRLSENIKELAFSITDAIVEKKLQQLEQEERDAEAQADRMMVFANGNAAAEAQIQQQLAERKAEIEEKRLETERKAFLFQQAFKAGEIAIDTIKAVAALKAQAAILLASPIPGMQALATVALSQIPLVIASGAVAGAAVLAQTIPQFKDGVRDFGGGLAVVGDGGVSEVITTPKGVFKTPATDTLVNLPKGSNVYKNQTDFDKELQDMLNYNGIVPFKDTLYSNMPSINVTNNGMSAVEMDAIIGKHFANIKTHNTIIDKNGIKTFISKGHSKTIDLNNRVTQTGISV